MAAAPDPRALRQASHRLYHLVGALNLHIQHSREPAPLRIAQELSAIEQAARELRSLLAQPAAGQ